MFLLPRPCFCFSFHMDYLCLCLYSSPGCNMLQPPSPKYLHALFPHFCISVQMSLILQAFPSACFSPNSASHYLTLQCIFVCLASIFCLLNGHASYMKLDVFLFFSLLYLQHLEQRPHLGHSTQFFNKEMSESKLSSLTFLFSEQLAQDLAQCRNSKIIY